MTRGELAAHKNETGLMKLTMMGRRSSAWIATVAAAFVAAVTLVQPAFAQQIVVRGNQRVDAETIRSYVTGTGAGSLEEARRGLLQTGMFSDVRIARSGSQVVVSVSENRIINRVFFEGNRKVERATLEPEMQSKARGAYNPAAVEADVERIRQIYQRTGRGLATVTPRIVDLPNGRVDVVFTINEGSKTGILSINFVGNRHYSGYRLRDLMNSSEMNFLSFLKTSDVYDPDRLSADQELIRRFYLKNGFADFRFVSTDAQFDAARGGWIITMTVEEGEQYRVGAVQLDSRLGDVDPEVLRRRIRTVAGQVYNAEAVERSLTDVTTEVARRGYAFAQVRPTGMRDPATRTINIGYVVEEGPRVYIERINVRGNTRTRDHVIRREIDLGEGDAYNKVLLDRAERRLNSLGYFKRVRITNEPGTAPDRVVVNIDVEDQPTGSFSIAGGYSTADGVIGEVSVSEFELPRPRPVRPAGRHLGPALPGRRFLLHRAVLPRLPHGGRLRPFLEVHGQYALRALREPRHRGPAASRTAGDRGVRLYAALFALPDRTQDPEHDQTAIQRLRDPDPGIHRPQSERHRHLSDLRHRRRDLGRAEGGRGQDPDLARRRDLRLQHARQRQEPEERHLRRAQARHCGPRRRLRSSSAWPATPATITSSSTTWSGWRESRVVISPGSATTAFG